MAGEIAPLEERVAVAIPAVARFADEQRASSDGGPAVLLVTHGGVINRYLPELPGVPGIGVFYADEAGFAVIHCPPGGLASMPPRVTDAAAVASTHRVNRMD